MEPLIIAPPDRKQQWAERAKEIMATFPSIELLNWDKVFELDPVIAGRIINDIIKIGGPSTGRPGKRASLTEQEASSRYRQIIGEDFSYSPFQDAFKDLCGKRSLSTVANLTGLDRNAVYRLIKGKEHLSQLPSEGLSQFSITQISGPNPTNGLCSCVLPCFMNLL